MAELRILGPPQLLTSDGQPVEVLARQAKRTALLAYLAAAVPRGFQRRDKLVALFWPELDEPHARNALSQALHVLRSALGEGAILVRGDGEVGVNPDVVRCDVPAFEEALDAGRPAEAAALYRGDLLDGLFVAGAPEFERWLDSERARLRLRASEGGWALAQAKAAEGHAVEAERWARRAADLVPADEAVVRRLMTFLNQLGDRAAAIRAYEAFAWRLAHEFELEPSGETRALAAAIREEEQHAPGPRSTPPAPAPTSAGRAARGRRRVGRLRALALGGLLVLGAIGVWLRWPRGEPGARGELHRIAVLPVTNLAGDAEQDPIADGMTDLLINYLSRISGFDRVISRTSVMPYKQTQKSLRQIGRELGVDVLVEASVLHDGERVRINVSLIDAATEQRRWSDSFDRPLRNVLALQRDLAQEIAREVAVALTPEEVVRLRQAVPSIDPMAFSLYLQALRSPWRNLSELQQKVAYLEQAVALDSGFAAAYVALAIHSAVDLTDYARAEEVVQRALALDPYLPSAHVAHALVRQWAHSDWAGAEAALRRALDLAPLDARSHHELAMLLMRLGRFDDALAAEERALYLDPPSSHYQQAIGEIYLLARRYDEAIREFEKTLRMDPGRSEAYSGRNETYWFLGTAYFYKGQYDVAARWFEQGGSIPPYVYPALGQRPRALAARDSILALAELGGLRAAGLQSSELQAAGYMSAVLVRLLISLGEHEQALDWLERIVDEHLGWVPVYLKVLPDLDPLRGEPRFQALLEKVGLDR